MLIVFGLGRGGQRESEPTIGKSAVNNASVIDE